MSEMLYCATCNKLHPKEDMVEIYVGKGTKRFKRWRCKTSIAASKAPLEERDRAGRELAKEMRQRKSRAMQEAHRLKKELK